MAKIKSGTNANSDKKIVRSLMFVSHADAADWGKEHFTLQHLNTIITDIGCPPLKDTPSTREIIQKEGIALFKKENPEFQVGDFSLVIAVDPSYDKKSWKLHNSLSKDWQKFREQLDRLQKELPNLEKLKVVSTILDELQPMLCSTPRTQGQHGGMALKDTTLAFDIFSLLPNAWKESGNSSKIDAESRYKIIQKCLELIGQSVGTPAIRIAIREYKPKLEPAKWSEVEI